jgi:hypothetical protein
MIRTHTGRPDNVLQVLEETVFVLVRRLGLHLRNALNLALQDEEPLVLEIDASVLEEGGDLLEG